MKEMFNDNYVELNASIHPLEWIKIIIDMTKDNICESVAILRRNGAFDNDEHTATAFVEKMYETDPKFKSTFGYEIYSLLREYENFTRKKSKNNFIESKDKVFKVKSMRLWKRHFPLTSKNILMKAKTGMINLNSLQLASYNAIIHSSPEQFDKFCKEVEILFLSTKTPCIDGVIIFNKLLYQEVILKINESYNPLSRCGFGWRAILNIPGLFKSENQKIDANKFIENIIPGLFESEVQKIGADKFVENINNQELQSKFVSSLIGIPCHSEVGNFSLNFKKNIVDSIKKIPKDKISIHLLIIACSLLETEEELRKDSRIIEFLPKLNNNELKTIEKSSLYFKIVIAQFRKVSEIELGINDTFPDYSENKLYGAIDWNYFKDGININFLKKHFNLLDDKLKIEAMRELFVSIIFHINLNTEPILAKNEFFIPGEWSKGLRLMTKFSLLNEFLKEHQQQKDFIELLNNEFNLISLEEINKKSLTYAKTDKHKLLVTSCFNIMIGPTSEIEGYERNV